MATMARPAAPGHFWAVAALALLWGVVACWGYVAGVTMTEADLAALPPAQAETWRETPSWIMGVYAVAVWSCLAGAVALLLRRAWARPLFIVSLAAAVLQFGYTLSQTRILELGGPSAAILPVVIWLIGAGLIWYSTIGIRRGWLR